MQAPDPDREVTDPDRPDSNRPDCDGRYSDRPDSDLPHADLPHADRRDPDVPDPDVPDPDVPASDVADSDVADPDVTDADVPDLGSADLAFFVPDVLGRDWYANGTATFGDRLAGAREAVGMTAEDLARRLGVKAATLDRWENDLVEPRANRLSVLAGLLNVSLRWLLTGEGEGLPPPGGAAPLDPDVTHLLTELRQVQGDMIRMADRLGRLEKALKQTLTDAPR